MSHGVYSAPEQSCWLHVLPRFVTRIQKFHQGHLPCQHAKAQGAVNLTAGAAPATDLPPASNRSHLCNPAQTFATPHRVCRTLDLHNQCIRHDGIMRHKARLTTGQMSGCWQLLTPFDRYLTAIMSLVAAYYITPYGIWAPYRACHGISAIHIPGAAKHYGC